MVQLKIDQLEGEAIRRHGGFSDFGGAEYREGLQVLLASIESEANLSFHGLSYIQEEIIRILGVRLKLSNTIAQNPRILEQNITKPAIIIGLPRTGTTLLQNLLALDPNFHYLTEWQVHDPCPPRGMISALDSKRIKEGDLRWQQLLKMNPNIASIHDGSPESVAECQNLLAYDFKSLYFPCLLNVPTYMDWLGSCDMTSAYRLHQKFLKLFQSVNPVGRWLLKSPSHIFSLTELLETYPDADVLVTLRDPVRVVPSFVSLVSNYHVLFSNGLDAGAVAKWAQAQLAKGLERMMASRKELNESNVCDVHYSDLMESPQSTVETIYQKMGWQYSDELRTRSAQWLLKNPINKHGKHTYAKAGFQLQSLDPVFPEYVARYGIRSEE